MATGKAHGGMSRLILKAMGIFGGVQVSRTYNRCAACVITGRNNFYYVLLAFYLIAIIFLEIYAKAGLKPRDLTSLATTKRRELKSQPKQEETYREYSEPQEYEDNYSYLETELEELTLDDINEMLGETPTEEQTAPTQEETPYEGDSDLIDEILKEIEMEKK